MITKEEALRYHSDGRPGKIKLVPTKPTVTARDLSLAYSPGVAEPCREIAKRPGDAYRYTAKGNLVAVIGQGLFLHSHSFFLVAASRGRPAWRGRTGKSTESIRSPPLRDWAKTK